MYLRPTFEEIKDSANRIRVYIHRTPILHSHNIDRIFSAEIYFKCENFQKVGSFKPRGAINAILQLSRESLKQGVATHSSGNFAQAIAYSAQILNIRATIIMPRTSPKVKVEAVRSYGADIIFCEPTLEARESTLNDFVFKSGATFVHPYNDYNVIAGQGTAALELLENNPALDIIIAPIGGGGLISGTAIASKAMNPSIEVIAGEPKRADDAYRSIEAGYIIPSVNPQTIADGLLTSLGDMTFPIIQSLVNRILTVSEDAIISAMKLIFTRLKIIVEPSSAVSLATLLEYPEHFIDKKVGIILSGGNVDIDNLPWYRKTN